MTTSTPPPPQSSAGQGNRKASFLVLSLAPLFLAFGFLQVAISAWLPTVGFTPFQVGVIITVEAAFEVVLSIPLGIASDMYGRKLILIAASLAGTLGLLIFALATIFALLLVGAAILGFAAGATLATWNALLADLTEPEARNRIFAQSYIMTSVGMGTGLFLPGIFPLLESLFGLSSQSLHVTFLLLLGLLSLASPIGVAAVLKGHREASDGGRKFSGFKNMRVLAKLGIATGAIGFGAGFIMPLIGTWFLLRFGVGDSYSGPMLAISLFLIGLAAFASPRLAKNYGQLNAIVLTMGSSMFFMLGIAFVPDVNLAAGLFIIRSALMNMANPLIDSFSMSIFPTEQRGLVSAISNIIFRLPNSVSTLFGGYMLNQGLLQLPFIIASALYIVGVAAFYAFFVSAKGKPIISVPM
jgi:MFS family permease